MGTLKTAILEPPVDKENIETIFGKRWGGQTISLTENDLQKLRTGKIIALDIMDEYIVYLQIENTLNSQ